MNEAATEALLLKLIELLGDKSLECSCGGAGCRNCCDCTTERTFEGSAARFNESAAFSAGESQKMFVQQNAAQFSHLLQMQNDSRST